ncbi:endonuclease domain-containing protein [Streptomyces bottropensis]|uniref:endonuclease domain-containing protein n=1 Tax=Streptomyces bottropensis TaxID=42235 RepID=UPI00381E292E
MADLRKQIDMSESTALATPAEPDRACPLCGVVKPAAAFHKAGPGRRRKVCAACRPKTRLRRGEQSLEKRRERHRRGEFKLIADHYERLFAAQNGECAICRIRPQEGQTLCIDHCHQSGRVRALLCGPCNIALGGFEKLHGRAEEYLAKYGDGNPLLGYNSAE